ncbi:MAG: cadherin repeat domain-containing protein, partial [Candidatus Thioglobus sp.]
MTTTITYSLSGSDTNAFTINSTTGVITANAEFDFETPTDDDADNVYNLTITVTDADDNANSVNVIITITNVFENTLTITDQIRPVAENSASGDAVGAVLETTGTPTAFIITAGDTATFAIDNSGQITIADNSTLDYETTDNYPLTVQISKDDAADVTAQITITITNVNENTLTIADQTREVAENANNGDAVGDDLVTTGGPCLGVFKPTRLCWMFYK